MADIYTQFVSGLLFPLHERLKKHSSVAVREAMEEFQWWDAARLEAVASHGAELLVCSEREGRVDLEELFQKLGAAGIQSILLEGGSHLAGAALRAGLIDRCMIFLAPKLVGGFGMGLFAGDGVAMMGDALRLEGMTVKRIGADLLVQGTPVKQGLGARG